MPRIQGDLDRQAVMLNVQHPETAPGLFGVHDLLIDSVDIRFDEARLMFIGYQDSVGTCRNDDIVKSHGQDGNIQFIDYVHIFAGRIHDDFTDRALRHGFRERIPCSEVLPRSVETHDLNIFLFLDDSIIETGFRQ